MVWCNDSFICTVLIIFFCTPLIPGPLNLCSYKWLIIGAQTLLPCFLNFLALIVKVAYLVHWSSRQPNTLTIPTTKYTDHPDSQLSSHNLPSTLTIPIANLYLLLFFVQVVCLSIGHPNNQLVINPASELLTVCNILYIPMHIIK